jgi:integrase/recombinase XerD
MSGQPYKPRNRTPNDSAVKPINDWLSANQGLYSRFRSWLKDGGYSDSAVAQYGSGVRTALGWLDRPYWEIDAEDLERVRVYVTERYAGKETLKVYLRGIAKLEAFLRHCCQRPEPSKQPNWDYHIGPLPGWLAADVRTYVTHCQRNWTDESQYRATCNLLSRLTVPLRWIAERSTLSDIGDLTPDLWYAYLDARLDEGIQPASLNVGLRTLQLFLTFLADSGRPICRRMLQVDFLKQSPRLPRDVPVDQLQIVQQEIEADAAAEHAGTRYMGVLDRAWFLMMLHSGLRVGEVRRLRQTDLDLDGRRVRIEQSKGLKDRVVWLTQVTVDALRAYLEIRGPARTDHVFVFHHKPLSSSYCGQRLDTYGRRCGIHVTCHQLRHSHATLLLNAGAPILTIQALLGHKHIDTTLVYARLYDGVVAADYYRAMAEVEARMGLSVDNDASTLDAGKLLALVDSLWAGTLNESQRETVQELRSGILTMVEQMA